MALETGDFIDDLVITNPVGNVDLVRQGAPHFRQVKKSVRQSFAGTEGAILISGADGGSANTVVLSPTPALPEYSPRMLVLWKQLITNTGAATLKISALAATPIVSVGNAALAAGDLVAGRVYMAVYDGTSFQLIAVTKNYIDSLAFSSALPAQAGNSGKVVSTDGTAASWKTLVELGGATLADGNTFTKGQNYAKGPDIASAATTMDIWAAAQGNVMTVTGATTTTGLPAAPQAGATRTLIAAAAWPLTHGANFILPGSANYTCAAGDIIEVTAITTTQFRLKITKANGTPVVAPATAMTLLPVVTSTAAAVANVETTFDGTYDRYILVAIVTGVEAPSNIRMRQKIGGSYITSSDYSYNVDLSNSGSSTPSISSGTETSIKLSEVIQATGGDFAQFTIEISNPTSTTQRHHLSWTGSTSNGTQIAKAVGAGGYRNGSSGALTGIQFFASGGHHTGKFYLYGLAKS